jgi:hypothetical protein
MLHDADERLLGPEHPDTLAARASAGLTEFALVVTAAVNAGSELRAADAEIANHAPARKAPTAAWP